MRRDLFCRYFCQREKKFVKNKIEILSVKHQRLEQAQ